MPVWALLYSLYLVSKLLSFLGECVLRVDSPNGRCRGRTAEQHLLSHHA